MPTQNVKLMGIMEKTQQNNAEIILNFLWVYSLSFLNYIFFSMQTLLGISRMYIDLRMMMMTFETTHFIMGKSGSKSGNFLTPFFTECFF